MDRFLSRTPTITPVTLPNLRWFWFQGSSAYLEAVVRWITTPRLERPQVFFFEQLTFSVPHLVHLMNTTETLRFNAVTVDFSREQVDTVTSFPGNAEIYLYMRVICPHLDWQVSSMAQIFDFFPAKRSLRWSISLFQARYTVTHLMSIMRSTAQSGTNFLGRFTT
jgi:hypothetical protein